MDREKLVECVRCYPCLWQASSKGYRYVRIKDNACREVSVQTLLLLLRRIITYRAKTSAILNRLLRSRSMGDSDLYSQLTTRAYFQSLYSEMNTFGMGVVIYALVRRNCEPVVFSFFLLFFRDATHRYDTCDQHHNDCESGIIFVKL